MKREVQSLYQMTSKLEKAFREINFLCTEYLSGKTNDSYDQDMDDSFVQKKNIIQKKAKAKDQSKKERLKAPLSPYFLFMSDKRDTIKKQYPQLTPGEISTVMGQVWNSLTETEKKPYIDQYKKSKFEYEKGVKGKSIAPNPSQEGQLELNQDDM